MRRTDTVYTSGPASHQSLTAEWIDAKGVGNNNNNNNAVKTLRNDYDWFRIIDRETSKETTKTESRSGFSARYERIPEKRCGLLGCTTTYRDHYRGGFESNFPDHEDTVYTVTLEFEMGTGTYANARNVYEARSIRNSNR